MNYLKKAAKIVLAVVLILTCAPIYFAGLIVGILAKTFTEGYTSASTVTHWIGEFNA